MDNKFRDRVISAFFSGSVSEEALHNINQLAKELCGSPLYGELASRNYLSRKKETIECSAEEMQAASSQEQSPKITFIVPTHNRVNLLPRCIDSILSQCYPNKEIIIIDDCSSDGTEEYVQEHYSHIESIIYLRNKKNLGPGGTRQKAYRASTGEFLIFIDDDDFYIEPSFAQTAIQVFREHENVGMVCANSLIYDVVSKSLSFYPLSFCGELTGKEFFVGFRTKYRKPNSTFPTVFRRAVLDKADFENMWMMNDTSIYLRSACYGDVYMISQWVGCYLVHDSNISKSLPHKFILENLDEKKNIYAIAKKSFGVNMDSWYFSQIMDTASYYLLSEKISFVHFASVIKWMFLNGGAVRKELVNKVIKIQYRQVCK